jgi:hypothetical protein
MRNYPTLPVDPQTYAVSVNEEKLVSAPIDIPSLAQRYFLLKRNIRLRERLLGLSLKLLKPPPHNFCPPKAKTSFKLPERYPFRL